jgi:Coiled-coil domain containing protein (DUF2052)
MMTETTSEDKVDPSTNVPFNTDTSIEIIPPSDISNPTPSTLNLPSTISSPPPSKTQIQNRRLTYLNRSDYLISPTTQKRLFPHLYEKLVLRHETRAEKLSAEKSSKQRTLTNVFLEAHDHLEKAQLRRDRSDDVKEAEKAREEYERVVVESTASEVLRDREKSLFLLEKMMRERFLAGGDEEFVYDTVDGDSEWDDWEVLEEDARAEYFDTETPEEEQQRILTGQTGVQDF